MTMMEYLKAMPFLSYLILFLLLTVGGCLLYYKWKQSQSGN